MEGIYNANGEKAARTVASFHPDEFKGRYSDGKTLRRIVRTDEYLWEWVKWSVPLQIKAVDHISYGEEYFISC